MSDRRAKPNPETTPDERSLQDAADAYRRAFAANSGSADLACNLGVSLTRLGQWREACDVYRQALRLRPEFVEVWCNLGNACKELGEHAQAIDAYRQAIAIRPDFAEAYFNLGNSYHTQGDHARAIDAFERALAIRPNYPKAENNLGSALKDAGRLDESLAAYRRALALRPDYAAAELNLARALQLHGQHREAAYTALQHVASIDPDNAETQFHLGVALTELGRYDEALQRLGRAIELQPDHAEAHTSRAIVRLLLGNLGQGFAEYQWRFQHKDHGLPAYDQPLWEGSDLTGRTILLHSEQGMGDVLQFVRYLPLVKKLGGRTLLGCYPPLTRILSRTPGLDQIVTVGQRLPHFDVHAPLVSLPSVFATTLDTIPAQIPYIFVDPATASRWQRELSEDRKVKVGIAWQGNPKNTRDKYRSIPLKAFAGLATLPNIRLFSLQTGAGTEQLSQVADDFEIIDVGSRFQDFSDTAAVLRQLDLIITVDSAVAHLAGALGLPTWILISTVPDWRWLLDREDTPWYPTVRLFRQHRPDRWDEVFERIIDTYRQRKPPARRS